MMRVLSTNTGERKTITWKSKVYTTGIFKTPTADSIFLGKEDVEGDVVYDRKYHGGIDKACYLFSTDHYPWWQERYPELTWNFGMFGENISAKGFDEREISIGDQFQIGTALVQVSEARQPCSNLNLRFRSSSLVKEFVKFGHCGAYLRVIQPGSVRAGDPILLHQAEDLRLTLYEIFRLLYDKNADPDRVSFALNHPTLGADCKQNLRKFHKH